MMKICLMCGKNFDVIHVRPNVQASNLMHQKYCSETGKRDEDFNILCANCNILYEYDRGKRYRGYQEIAHKI
jgi:hypothetical protein